LAEARIFLASESYEIRQNVNFYHVSAFFLVAGGLFEEANSVEEIAFKYAVDHINRNRYDFALGCSDFPRSLYFT
jgi:hypothetical protein